MRIRFFWIGLVVLLISCDRTTSRQENTRTSHPRTAVDTCDGPDANIECCFIGMPDNLNSILTIAPSDEPGERLVISGTIFRDDGVTPYPDVLIYAYHTDNTGHYSKKGSETGIRKWHGHLHGWGRTDKEGHYAIHSIRPARYPDNTIPAHIHAAIREPDGERPYYINDFVFRDDSLVNEEYVRSLTNPGGTGVVEVKKEDGMWVGRRDIVLKKGSTLGY